MLVMADQPYWICDECRADSRDTPGMWSVDFRTLAAKCPQCAGAGALEEAAEIAFTLPLTDLTLSLSTGRKIAAAIRALKEQDNEPGT